MYVCLMQSVDFYLANWPFTGLFSVERGSYGLLERVRRFREARGVGGSAKTVNEWKPSGERK